MQSLSPASRYQQALREGSWQPDDTRREAIDRLDAIWQELATKTSPELTRGGLMAKLSKLSGKPAASVRPEPVQGL